ncbi:MAG: hypothetical protein ACYDEY_05070 [Acidimicrobiales bacterium]
MPPKKRAAKQDKVVPIEDYEHAADRRVNNPPAGLAHLDRDETPLVKLTYDPHLDPQQLLWSGKLEREEVTVPAPSIHVHEELSTKKIMGSVRRKRTQQSLVEPAHPRGLADGHDEPPRARASGRPGPVRLHGPPLRGQLQLQLPSRQH